MSNIIALHKLDKELQQSVIPDSLPQAFDISNQQDTAFYFFPARMQSERFISKDKHELIELLLETKNPSDTGTVQP